MGCNCKEKNQKETSIFHGNFVLSHNQTSPIEGCLYCAEKHISTAAALAREVGYSGVNRGYIIGEIVAACWHLIGMKLDSCDKLAAKLRDFRHKIQSRKEDEFCTNFAPYLEEIDHIIREQETNAG